MPTTTDWMQAWAAVIAVLVALIGVPVAIFQIRQIGRQLKNGTLGNMLALETDINARKERMEELNYEAKKLSLASQIDGKYVELCNQRMDSAIENWLNAMDRLCFCIKNDLFPEKDWKAEYRLTIIKIVDGFESHFGVSSKYTNIKDMYDKWVRE